MIPRLTNINERVCARARVYPSVWNGEEKRREEKRELKKAAAGGSQI